MSNNISLEQTLNAYRVMNAPSNMSWKKHWVDERFSSDDMLACSSQEQVQFRKRLEECGALICDNIKALNGTSSTLSDVVDLLISESNKNVSKQNRKVVYSTALSDRPVGKKAFETWNGLQIIDMDIKDRNVASILKTHIFNRLKNCNWFMGVTFSASGKGLHIYTKISIPQTDDNTLEKKKLLYHVNYRHKYSFVYISCLSAMDQLDFSKDDLISWMDMAMSKPQQGAFIGYDEHPLINTRFFEDFIYIDFDNVEDIGSPEVDWVSYPDLKEIFKRWEWFEDDSKDIEVNVIDKPDLEFDAHNKVHYKHFERWRLANTLVQLYGKEKGYSYLRMICSNNIKDKELQADCITAARHNKPVDIWAVNRLNQQHGFKIKLDIQDNADESELFKSMDHISNPTLIRESKNTITYNIRKNEYLGDIKDMILHDAGRITLLEAGAGVGKTEMVKSIAAEGKRVIMVMPFTSTIKAKVENNDNWAYSYGNRKPKLDTEHSGLSMTIDKFSHMNLMDIKTAGFEYIFIDESHLMFQSEYRPVMAKVIEMIRNSEVPIILMSGTPSGELVFFPDIVHIKVIKEDIRRKEFKVHMVNNPNELMLHMCRSMANDIATGKRILFPTNKGTLYAEQIKASVRFFLENDFGYFLDVKVDYYKKSNIGEGFMDSVNFEKTVKDTNILMCTNYLSVGVDILDKYEFSIYFADLMMPQEVEQFANRLRSNDLYINLYIAKNDADGNSRMIHKYREMNFKMNDDEIRNIHSILRICNGMIERNPIEYKYNSLVASIIHDNKFIEYNEVENKYYMNEIAYKVIYFERKYRDYVQQLPVLMKGMQAYGYNISSVDMPDFSVGGQEKADELRAWIKTAYDDRVSLNTSHIEELLDIMTEDRMNIYKDVLSGLYDIKKGPLWKEDISNRKMTVKNIEVFEKVVPIFISMSKRYDISSIKEIFEFCRNKNGSFNFAAINRIRILTNILYNDKLKRLDIPIEEFMKESYKLSERGKINKNELIDFINDFATRYAKRESTDVIRISESILTMQSLVKKLDKIFRCLVEVSRPTKAGVIKLKRVELLWKEKTYLRYNEDDDKVFVLNEFLNIIKQEDNEMINLDEITECEK